MHYTVSKQAASQDYDFSGAAYPSSIAHSSAWGYSGGSNAWTTAGTGLPGSSLEAMNTAAASVMASLKQGVDRLDMSHRATQVKQGVDRLNMYYQATQVKQGVDRLNMYYQAT
jgi:hypothetical protein